MISENTISECRDVLLIRVNMDNVQNSMDIAMGSIPVKGDIAEFMEKLAG